MFRLFLLIALIPAVVFAQLPYRPCGAGIPFPNAVRIANCNAHPCNVQQGGTASISVDFRANFGATGLRPTIHAWLANTRIPYVLPPQFHNGCLNLQGQQCPLSVNHVSTYNFDFLVNPTYPPIPVGVELNLLNHLNQVLFCVIVDVQVVR